MKLKTEPVDPDDMNVCMQDDCFEWATWFVEGFFYCAKHKHETLKAFREHELKREKEK